MDKIAALITCHNRKNKTLTCLKSLYEAKTNYPKEFIFDVYLTDDGSTDGTGYAVRKQYPNVKILKGNGKLYWAGGMRNSWNEALKDDYDGYLLVNDDTILFKNLFEEITNTEKFSLQNYQKKGIYIGSTKDNKTMQLTYGGAVLRNNFFLTYEKLSPSGQPQLCDLGNANIMYVSSEVINKIGILNDSYQHGVADYDYTLTARKKGIPVLIVPDFCGMCENDKKNKYEIFNNKPFKERLQYLFDPTFLAFKDNLFLMRRHFIYRLPFVFLSGWLKVIFPKLYALR
jgi:GT2 family glycosyltransferase